MFEIDGVPEDLAAEAILRGAAKLPLGTRFVRRIQQQQATGEEEAAA
jgi:ribosomal protein L16/L10AE